MTFSIRTVSRTSTPSRQRGVTLIEILITLLVLAIGLLGLAALQGISLQTGQASYQRTQAVNIAYEISDFARANRSIVSQSMLETLGNHLAQDRLPGGTTAVTVGADDQVTITVTWTDSRMEDLQDSTGKAEQLAEQFTTRI